MSIQLPNKIKINSYKQQRLKTQIQGMKSPSGKNFSFAVTQISDYIIFSDNNYFY